jgi:hypothetical protein
MHTYLSTDSSAFLKGYLFGSLLFNVDYVVAEQERRRTEAVRSGDEPAPRG